MSFTMTRGRVWRLGHEGMIKGVCATVADRAGVPVWMPRAAFVVFAVLHWFLAGLLYVGLAKAIRPAKRRVAQPDPAMRQAGAVRDRFSALDQRLADLEAASLQQERLLRRQFRDLERS